MRERSRDKGRLEDIVLCQKVLTYLNEIDWEKWIEN